MAIIDGSALSRELLEELRADLEARPGPGIPRLVFIRVGEDPASVSYVRLKEKAAARTGISSETRTFPPTITQDELEAEIDALNADASVHGVLVQSPLPDHIDERAMFNRVSPAKDVDGFNEINVGRLVQESPDAFVACTPAGIIELLKRSQVVTSGRHVVIVGRSQIVGKPAALLLLQKGLGDATVTVCHSRTRDLAAHTRQADILIAAIGRPDTIGGDMVKPGAVVIDVGVNRIPDSARKSGFRLVGDVDFPAVSPRVSAITPVPGGVGPMTVAMVIANTMKAYRQQTDQGV
ncbi:MAG: bifunctional 5,10-methylenetetrahydrofolate dehydrogenase/5,10-methenyltetrahydrofolate cyclohydrolase [Opitutales bacterium]